MINSDLFGDFDFTPDTDDDIQIAKKEDVDLFKEVLPALLRGDYTFYSRLSDEKKKGFSAYVVARWCTSPNTLQQDAISNVNDLVNVDFWTISDHPELQYMLMCIAFKLTGLPLKTRFSWVPFMGGKKSSYDDISKSISAVYPGLENDEIMLLRKLIDVSEYESFLKSQGTQDTELKKLIKLWKSKK